MLLLALAVYGSTQWFSRLGPIHPVALTYELDFREAPSGRLTITLLAEGQLPPTLALELPPSAFGSPNSSIRISRPEAHSLTAGGGQGASLALERNTWGWQLQTEHSQRVGIIYQVTLLGSSPLETDIRKHISAPVNGGLRAAGYEVFLQPANLKISDLTVAIHNPRNLPFMAPWPALIRNSALPTTPASPVGQANLASGMGFIPSSGSSHTARAVPPNQATPMPDNLIFHPRDLEDMNNSLLICGNITTAVTQARDTVIQLATDRAWAFPLRQARELVATIARTEIAFFGTAPTDQITVMLAANDVTSSEGFDAYGMHTGSSILIMLDPQITAIELQENAASVIAHEMFHGWLGEAVPQTDPQTLWFTEGATTWFAARMLTASGLWTPAHAREVLRGRLAQNYARSPLLGRISVAAAAAEVMANSEQVRYAYAGGVASCMALDHWLATESGMMRPLDQILRVLYEDHAGEALSRASLIAVIHKVTGVDSTSWLDQHVYGTKALPPLANLL